MKNTKKIISGVLTAAFLLSFAGCDAISNSSKKAKKDTDTDAIVEAASDYTEALKKMDFKKIKKLASDIDKDAIDVYEALYDLNSEYYEIVLDTVKFEIDEDSAEIDDDEGSIDVTYKYVDLSGLDATTVDIFEDEVDDCDDTAKGKFTIEFEIDDDEYLVSNADKVFDSFWEDVTDIEFVGGGSNSTDDIIEPTDVDDDDDDDKPYVEVDLGMAYTFFVYAEHYWIGPNDTMGVMVESFPMEVSSADATLRIINDSTQKVIYECDITIRPNETQTYHVTPADCGLTKFEEGSYTLEVEYKDYDFSEDSFVTVDEDSDWGTSTSNDDTSIVTDTVTDSDSDMMVPDSDKLGYMEGTVYYNEYFGFSIDFAACEHILTPEEFHDGVYTPDGNYVIDCFGMKDQATQATVGITITTVDMSKHPGQSIGFPDTTGTDNIINDFGGVQVLCLGDNQTFVLISGTSVLKIEFRATTTDDYLWINDTMATIKAI